MHVFGGILEVSLSLILILHREHRDGLKPTPPDRESDGIITFQNLRIPTMSLDASIDESQLCFVRQEASKNDRQTG